MNPLVPDTYDAVMSVLLVAGPTALVGGIVWLVWHSNRPQRVRSADVTPDA